MANVIEITIKQTGSGNAIPTTVKQLGGLSKVADTSSGTLKKLGSALGGVATIAAGVAAGGLLALGVGLTKVISTGLGFNNAMEQASARINAFTKDANLTADILELVQARAAKTPFAFEEMANAAAALMPTMKASGESLEFLLQQAEILAASNPMEGLQGASFALKEAVSGDFTSIIERFNLSRTTLNELKEQGIPALEAVGIAMAELGLDTDLVTALAETAEGRWSTFKDTLTTLSGMITQPIFETLSQSLGDINAWLVQIGPQLEAFATMLATKIASGIALAQAAMAAFQTGGVGGLLAALGFGPEVMETINATIAYITEQFNALVAVLSPSLASLQESFARLSVTFGEAGITSGTFTEGLLAMANFIIGTVIPAWVQWIGFLAGAAAAAFSAWVTYIQTAYSAFQTLSAFIQTSVIPFFMSMSDEVTLLGELFGAVLAFNIATTSTALRAMAGLWQNVLWPALQRVGQFIQTTVSPAFVSIGETVRSDVSPVLKDLGEVVLPILNEGIEMVIQAIKDMIGYFNAMKDAVNSFQLPDILTPGSPPPMANALTDIAAASDLAAKAIEGFGASTGNVKKFVDDLDMGGIARRLGAGGGQWRNFRNIIKNTIGGNFEQLMSGGMSAADIIRKIQDTAERFNFPPSFASEFAQANGLIEHLNSSVAEFQEHLRMENMGRLIQVAGQLSGLGQGFADMLQPEMDAREKMIKRLQEFTAKGGTEELFKFDFAPMLVGVDHVMMDRIQAQEQLNELVRQQQEQEELITQQKEAQQKLSFLQAQVDLIKLGRELGGNIFQGMTFGLDASVEDLLAATNAVVEAMVGQIDSTLGIASPSRVMFDKFKNEIGGGMVRGLMAVRPVLSNVISPMLSPMTGGESSRTTNNNFSMTVNTRAEQSSVIGDFRTMQLLAGA